MSQSAALGWVELWKVYEIVWESVKPARIERLAWMPAEHSTFGASANRPDISGASARHARMGGSPPKHRMTLTEGRQFVSQLVTAWLNSLLPSDVLGVQPR
jgi:hypothetical protein